MGRPAFLAAPVVEDTTNMLTLTPLMSAVLVNSVNVPTCLSADDVNATSGNGRTALHYAVLYNDDPAIIDLLLDAPGIRVGVEDCGGFTALGYARLCRRTHAIAKLEATLRWDARQLWLRLCVCTCEN